MLSTTALPTKTGLSCFGSSSEAILGRSDKNLAAELKPIITQFVAELNFSEPFVVDEGDKLKQAVFEHALATGVPCSPETHPSSFSALMVGYSTGCCFPDHPLEVRVWTSIYCWLLTIIDDVKHGSLNLEDVEKFQERCIKGEQQPSPTTKALARHLQLTYDHFHSLVANLIVSRTFEFVTSSALTESDGFSRLTKNPSPGGQSFPWYLRDKDGVGEAFAWFTFPKAKYPDPCIAIEAIPDMNKFICLLNDVLSFYKEELAGDKDNYVHGLAAYTGTDVMTALRAAAKEAIECSQRIEAVLDGTGIYQKAWNQHGAGYLHLHLTRARYKLLDLGIGQELAK